MKNDLRRKIVIFSDEAIECALYVMFFFIPISISMIGISAGIAIVFFLIKKILSPDFVVIKANKILFSLLLLFFVFMGLSLFNSGPLFSKSLKALFVKWGRFPVLLWVVIDTFRDTKRIVKAVYILAFSAALVGLTVFTQKFFGFEFLREVALADPSAYSKGPFKHCNSLGAYLTGVIPVVLALGLWNGFDFTAKWKKIVVKLCLFLVTGLLILSSFWTFSRGGWLGLISGLIFVVLFNNYNRIKKIFWPLLLFSYIFIVPLIGAALFLYCKAQDSGRFSLYNGAWIMIREHPFLGKGIGTFMDYSTLYVKDFGAQYTHNCYLQIWAESGIFSLLCFLILLGYIFYKSIKACLMAPKSPGYYILVGLNAGLLGFSIHAFFDVHFYSFQLSFLFWALLGMTVALNSKFDQVTGRDLA